ncbi:TniQ family protein [Methylobacterium sp. Leaf86]|uniref:TniQ family protein n=1 Tax=Methylobacterium sp. Leaf86 TaxID=1736242 RepID=UPI000AB9E5B4|nr:TniQ family protein [Methylobacterium sp. Leaf86]
MSIANLLLTLVLNLGESVTSFVSRLRAHNGLLSLMHFCADTGINFRGIVDGHPEEVGRLADIAGVSKKALQSWAFRRTGEASYSLRGHVLQGAALRRNTFHVCPTCLREDIEASRLDPELAAFGRTIWQVGFIRTCSRHGKGFIDIGQGFSLKLHDFTAMVEPHLGSLPALEETAAVRPFSTYEGYILSRIEGASEITAPFLDGLDLQVAAKFCEVLGLATLHDPNRLFRSFCEDDLYNAGAVGFDIAAGGRDAVCLGLSNLQRSYPYNSARNEGTGRPLGVLYTWLNSVRHLSGYEPLVELVRRHIIETAPVGQGDLVLGIPAERRVLHSIRTASLETGMHRKRLRQILARSGHLAPDHESFKDHATLFDATAAAGTLAKASDGMSLNEVNVYLNCGRVQAQVLLRSGIIEPFVHAAVSDGWHLFAKADIDDFSRRLLLGTVPVEDPVNGMMDIPSAARRCNCSASEVVQLILDGRLPWVGRRTDMQGYLSILIYPKDVRPLVQGELVDDLRLRQVQAALEMSEGVVKGLIELGVLNVRTVPNPDNRCPMRVVERASFEDFQSRYVSLSALAGPAVLSPPRAAKILAEKDVHPVWDRREVKLSIYRLIDVEPFIAELHQAGCERPRGRPPRDPQKPPQSCGRPKN